MLDTKNHISVKCTHETNITLTASTTIQDLISSFKEVILGKEITAKVLQVWKHIVNFIQFRNSLSLYLFRCLSDQIIWMMGIFPWFSCLLNCQWYQMDVQQNKPFIQVNVKLNKCFEL